MEKVWNELEEIIKKVMNVCNMRSPSLQVYVIVNWSRGECHTIELGIGLGLGLEFVCTS